MDDAGVNAPPTCLVQGNDGKKRKRGVVLGGALHICTGLFQRLHNGPKGAIRGPYLRPPEALFVDGFLPSQRR